jgi:hypothetical protein
MWYEQQLYKGRTIQELSLCNGSTKQQPNATTDRFSEDMDVHLGVCHVYSDGWFL